VIGPARTTSRAGNDLVVTKEGRKDAWRDKFPQFATETPKELGGATAAVFLFVEDVDAVVRVAADAGATITMEPEDQFWGDRLGGVTDPFGHVWLIATRVADLTPEEIQARSREVFASMS
jgi:PhnB protein